MDDESELNEFESTESKSVMNFVLKRIRKLKIIIKIRFIKLLIN